MGSLVPGWELSEPDFRHLGKQEAQVPEWLQRVRSTDAERDSGVKHAMDSAKKHMHSQSLSRSSNSGGSQQAGSPPTSSVHGKYPMHLQRGSSSVTMEGQSGSPLAGLSAERINWWQQVESSFNNEKPRAELEDYKGGNYTPQFAEARQHLEQHSS